MFYIIFLDYIIESLCLLLKANICFHLIHYIKLILNCFFMFVHFFMSYESSSKQMYFQTLQNVCCLALTPGIIYPTLLRHTCPSYFAYSILRIAFRQENLYTTKLMKYQTSQTLGNITLLVPAFKEQMYTLEGGMDDMNIPTHQ